MGFRRNYWSCSKFADWLRGTSKPHALTSVDWDAWRKLAQAQHRVRYWLAEEGLDMIQNALWWPLDQIYNVKYYINNRWVTRTHSLTAHPRDIRPGTWCDVGNRFLPCLFNELVDFVEIELAWFNIAFADKEERKRFQPPFWATGWLRWRTWRSPESGLAYLSWASNLKHDKDWGIDPSDPDYGQPTSQAVAAREIHELYRWWKEVRPNRVDPYEDSGWTQLCDDMYSQDLSMSSDSQTPEQQQAIKTSLDRLRELEAAYEQEDTDMLTRLILVRGHLWT